MEQLRKDWRRGSFNRTGGEGTESDGTERRERYIGKVPSWGGARKKWEWERGVGLVQVPQPSEERYSEVQGSRYRTGPCSMLHAT
jgi:hypothetical protein